MTCEHEFQPLPGQDVYQWCFGCGAVCRIADQSIRLPKLLDFVDVSRIELTAEEREYCRNGQKLEAYREIRKRTGLGLGELVQIVDEFMRNDRGRWL